jgi:hypothetical protein
MSSPLTSEPQTGGCQTDEKIATSTTALDDAVLINAAEGGIIGSIGGAVVGGIAGGPLGAVIGALLGGSASAAAVDIIELHTPSTSNDEDSPSADSDHPETLEGEFPPALAFYVAPGAFGTSLPGMVAPPIAATALVDIEPTSRSTDDDSDSKP